MQWNKSSKWIWIDDTQKEDIYADFYGSFDFDGKKAAFLISADSNYCVYINGKYAFSGQYPDFPHHKVYDEVDVTEFCRKGENSILVTVWYYGVPNMSYYPGDAGVRFEVYSDEELKLFSSENILSRKNPAFLSGFKQNITSQLGFSFSYDTTKEELLTKEDLCGFKKSTELSLDIKLNSRAIKKCVVGERTDSTLIKKDTNYYLFDIGKEEVGYLTLKVKSDKKQKLTIAYGEHIVDGGVRRIIDERDFSVYVTVGEGVTEYTNYFRRLGLRYLEIWSESEIEIEYASVMPVTYPLKKIDKIFEKPLHQKIYDICVRTLELCLHDHYEDCPWREQALYAMDSRNQMLCGYYVFEEFDFPRDNLLLMSKDDRDDGLLSICTPSGNDLTIPSFSLHYFIEVYEYLVYSKDLSLAKEVFEKLKSVMNVFLNQMENGLVKNFKNMNNWNFYEWTENLCGYDDDKTDRFDCALNCLLSIALEKFRNICELIGEKDDYVSIRDELNKNIREKFYNPKTGLYIDTLGRETYSELTNSLAVLCGASSGGEAEEICEKLTSSSLPVPISLSMICFKYDALIMVDEDRYKDYIIKNIEEKYEPMIQSGATSFWETEMGEKDFDNAGSLCHGWSAMPVYYFCRN